MLNFYEKELIIKSIEEILKELPENPRYKNYDKTVNRYTVILSYFEKPQVHRYAEINFDYNVEIAIIEDNYLKYSVLVNFNLLPHVLIYIPRVEHRYFFRISDKLYRMFTKKFKIQDIRDKDITVFYYSFDGSGWNYMIVKDLIKNQIIIYRDSVSNGWVKYLDGDILSNIFNMTEGELFNKDMSELIQMVKIFVILTERGDV